LPGKFSTTHIGYPFLKTGSNFEKSSYFEEFEIYLSSFNINEIQRVLNEVENQGYQADIGMIMDYFRFVKANPTIFMNLLKGVL